MELKDFIKGTISDIANSVIELNDEFKDMDIVINPIAETVGGQKEYIYYTDGRQIRDIEFNLSVAASETKEVGGGLHINVLKAGINNESNNQTVSTLKFSISLVLPTGKYSR